MSAVLATVLPFVCMFDLVRSAAYNPTTKAWNKAEIAKDLSTTTANEPAFAIYPGVKIKFTVDENQITLPAANELANQIKIKNVAFEVHGNLPDGIKNKLAGKSGNVGAVGKGTVTSDCTLLGKTTFEQVNMKGKINLIAHSFGMPEATCACDVENTANEANKKNSAIPRNSGQLDDIVREPWKKCGLEASSILSQACQAMTTFASKFMEENKAAKPGN